jgi:alanyl-tRNA synthetase
MNTRQLRQTFLTFFNERGHTLVPSSSLVPHNDPTLLFTNAGMVQFKDMFLGEKGGFSRAASSQRCVRAGGKHNDLENVGYTARHHTFFEMLGNFSFGDYFKKEAIRFAWDFLTQVLKIPEERLWVTVLEGDQESEDIWFNEIGVDQQRFSRCGPKDNFWSMGDTGPCGPCTEIFYDHGPHIPGGPPGSEEEGDRYIEIWNLVFMQFQRAQDGTLTPLPKPAVDTGMGLERIAAVMQGVHSNYEIDIFKNLIAAIAEIANLQDLENKSLRVIADHIRACAFLIVDGVVPTNEGRGYVLRRICRRAIRHGVQLGLHEPFFHLLVKPLIKEMGEAYPELVKVASQVERVLYQEEVQFARTLEQGLKILENDIAALSDKLIPGEIVFKLYDTYGFPADLTADIARERGFSIDMVGFNLAMEAQRARAREASQFSMECEGLLVAPHTSDFIGYDTLEEKVKVLALYQENKAVAELKKGDMGTVVLEKTPFYAEAGGQVGDQGTLSFIEDGQFTVQNTKKFGEAHLHLGVVKSGILKVGESVIAKVDKEKRFATAVNHSATHLLHAALKAILGAHIQQKGSLVEPLRLRFDFAHFEPLTPEQIRTIEQLVNEKILENTKAFTEVLPVEEALKTGAVALFGEKYGKTVRVLHMANDFSIELCGGTHVNRTGDIGLFKIVSEAAVAAGIRRIEALTGKAALSWLEEMQTGIQSAAKMLNCNWRELSDKVQQLTMRNRTLEKELQQLKKARVTAGDGQGLSLQKKLKEKVQEFNGVQVLAVSVPTMEIKTFREMVDNLKASLGKAVIVLGMVNEEKRVNLIAGVTSNCIEFVHSGKLIGMLAEQVGGKGGGRPEMAEAGGNQPQNLEAALSLVYKWVEERVKKAGLEPKERIRDNS